MQYSMEMFAKMFTGEDRHDAYMEALRRAVKPGDVVIDIGTGVGVYSLAAAQLGARKVYAIEPNPLVRLGPELAERNGVGDQVEFYQMLSNEFEPPEKADVIFADMRGRTPLVPGAIAAMHDAATRLLKPGGTLIPKHDVIYAALSAQPERLEGTWSNWSDNPFGFDLSPALRVQFAQLFGVAPRAEELLSSAQQVANIEYGVDKSVEIRAAWTATALSTGEVWGLSSWFEGVLLPGVDGVDGSNDVRIGCGPDRKPSVYSGTFLGFTEPLVVSEGDHIDVRLNAMLRGSGYVWSWSAALMVDGQVVDRRVGTTMDAMPITPRTLGELREERVIPASDSLRVDARTLALLAEGLSVGAVTDALMSEFPGRFVTVRRRRKWS